MGSLHYNDVVMGAMTSQITSLTIVYSIVDSGADQRKKSNVTGLCAGNSPMTGEFHAQMTSNAENVSIWWHHHEKRFCQYHQPNKPLELQAIVLRTCLVQLFQNWVCGKIWCIAGIQAHTLTYQFSKHAGRIQGLFRQNPVCPENSTLIQLRLHYLTEAEWRIYASVSMVQIMANRLVSAKPFSKPMLECL